MKVISLLLCLELMKISNITVNSQRCFAFNLGLASKCLFQFHGQYNIASFANKNSMVTQLQRGVAVEIDHKTLRYSV